MSSIYLDKLAQEAKKKGKKIIDDNGNQATMIRLPELILASAKLYHDNNDEPSSKNDNKPPKLKVK